MTFDTFGGRRYILTWAVGIAATALQWAGKLDPAGLAYSGIIVATVAAYITNNTWQKKSEGAQP